MTSKAQKNVDNNNVKKESPLFFLACCRQFSNMTNSRPAAKFFDLKQPQNYDGKKPLFYNIADSRISLFSITFIFHFSCMPSFIGHQQFSTVICSFFVDIFYFITVMGVIETLKYAKKTYFLLLKLSQRNCQVAKRFDNKTNKLMQK